LATKLKGLSVDEGSLVDKGANKEALVMLFKRHLDGGDAPDDENEGLLEKFLGYFKNLTSEEGSVGKAEDTELQDEIQKLDAKLLVDIGNIVGTDDEAKLSSIRVALEDYFERLTGEPAPAKKTDEKPFSGATKPFGSDKEDEDNDEDDDDDEKSKKKTRMKKGSDSMSITDEVREELGDDVQEYLTELEKRADDSNKVEELEAKVAELEKAAEETGEDEEVDIWKGVSSEVKQQFEDLQKKAETAESVAKAEKEMRISKEFEEKAAQFPKIGSVEEVSAMLRQAYDVNQESGEKLEQTFKAAAEKIDANDHLTKELGQSGDVASGGDAWDKIEALAEKLVEKDDDMSQEQAVSKILKTKEGKKLYDDYQTERSVN